jgi:predicted MFS family arabinose efflux permease
MPLALLGGYIAIVFCMTGDGIEQAFLSKYLVNLGFTAGDAALVFTVYGASAALSSWLSGVLAEVFLPRRIMLLGVAWWLVFHALFLGFGLTHPNLALTLIFYGIRGFAYPLFFYGFFVWVVQQSRPHELASAIGWTWGMFTIGYGIVGSYLPSFTIPWIGYMGTLWMSMAWVLVGGLLIFFFTRGVPQVPRDHVLREVRYADLPQPQHCPGAHHAHHLQPVAVRFSGHHAVALYLVAGRFQRAAVAAYLGNLLPCPAHHQRLLGPDR